MAQRSNNGYLSTKGCENSKVAQSVKLEASTVPTWHWRLAGTGKTLVSIATLEAEFHVRDVQWLQQYPQRRCTQETGKDKHAKSQSFASGLLISVLLMEGVSHSTVGNIFPDPPMNCKFGWYQIQLIWQPSLDITLWGDLWFLRFLSLIALP